MFAYIGEFSVDPGSGKAESVSWVWPLAPLLIGSVDPQCLQYRIEPCECRQTLSPVVLECLLLLTLCSFPEPLGPYCLSLPEASCQNDLSVSEPDSLATLDLLGKLLQGSVTMCESKCCRVGLGWRLWGPCLDPGGLKPVVGQKVRPG